MVGYRTILQIRDFENTLAKMGMRMGFPHYGNSYRDRGEVIAIMSADGELPAYNAGAELFIGTLAECENWLMGVQWARKYYEMLGIDEAGLRARHEDLIRQDSLAQALS
jgi:hypothetical protein